MQADMVLKKRAESSTSRSADSKRKTLGQPWTFETSELSPPLMHCLQQDHTLALQLGQLCVNEGVASLLLQGLLLV